MPTTILEMRNDHYKKNSIYPRIITHGSVSVGKFSIIHRLLPTYLYL